MIRDRPAGDGGGARRGRSRDGPRPTRSIASSARAARRSCRAEGPSVVEAIARSTRPAASRRWRTRRINRGDDRIAEWAAAGPRRDRGLPQRARRRGRRPLPRRSPRRCNLAVTGGSTITATTGARAQPRLGDAPPDDWTAADADALTAAMAVSTPGPRHRRRQSSRTAACGRCACGASRRRRRTRRRSPASIRPWRRCS